MGLVYAVCVFGSLTGEVLLGVMVGRCAEQQGILKKPDIREISRRRGNYVEAMERHGI